MTNPLWFNLIQQWREQGMGKYGISFPFFTGAISKINGGNVTKEFIEDLFNKIINEPIDAYYCEVRWCANLDEPVVSIEALESFTNKSIQASFESGNDAVSLAFTTDLMSMFTLNCPTKEECVQKLITKSLENTDIGKFSKNNGVFGDFTENEIKFINNVASMS